MSGSSRAITKVQMASVRMAGPATYIPAHIPAGGDKSLSQRATFNVYQNKGEAQYVFACTVWGKLADAIARGGAKGKELQIFGELRSYRGKVYVPNGTGQRVPFQMADGTFLMNTKINILVNEFIFGSDSDSTIDDEIQKGLRPLNWNTNGHPEKIAWLNECKRRNAIQFDPNSPVFGTAQVMIPQGATLVDPNQRNAGTGQVQGNGYAGQQYGGGQPQYAGNTQQVQGGFQQAAGAPGNAPATGGWQAPAQGQPVQVNGQVMGYSQQAPASSGFTPPNGPAQGQGGYTQTQTQGGAY